MRKILVVLFILSSLTCFSQGSYLPRSNSNFHDLRRLIDYLHLTPVNGSQTDLFDSTTCYVYFDSSTLQVKYNYFGTNYIISGGTVVDTDSIWNAIHDCVLLENIPTILQPFVQFTSLDSALAALGYVKPPFANSMLQHSSTQILSSTLNVGSGGNAVLGGSITINIKHSAITAIVGEGLSDSPVAGDTLYINPKLFGMPARFQILIAEVPFVNFGNHSAFKFSGDTINIAPYTFTNTTSFYINLNQ